MRNRQVSRRFFFEKWHRICVYCGIWFPSEKGSHESNCSVCGLNIEYCELNNLPPPREEHNPYVDYDAEDIPAELRGELPIKGLFESCSEDKIKALEKGNVEMFLSVKD